MAPVPGSIALKASAIAAVLAMLFVPSLGRCGHSRAPPPPPPPAVPTPLPPQSLPPTPTPAPPPSPTLTPPAPAPEPVAAIFCPHCFSDCFDQCDATTVSNCSGTCDPIDNRCSSCRTTAIQKCKDSSNCTGTCDECSNAPDGSCTSACDPHDCDLCMVLLRRKCSEDCDIECSPPRCTRECPPPQCILVTFSPPPPSTAPPPPPSAPTPPPPAPLPPNPPPAISCKDCSSQCLKACAASIASNCSDECNGNNASCISCRSTAIQSCRDFRNCTGSCDECNGAAGACNDKACSTRNCSPCTEFYRRQCEDDCKIQCSPPTCID